MCNLCSYPGRANVAQVAIAFAVESLCKVMRERAATAGTVRNIWAAPSVARVYAKTYTPAWDACDTADKDEADRLVRECYGECKRAHGDGPGPVMTHTFHFIMRGGHMDACQAVDVRAESCLDDAAQAMRAAGVDPAAWADRMDCPSLVPGVRGFTSLYEP